MTTRFVLVHIKTMGAINLDEAYPVLSQGPRLWSGMRSPSIHAEVERLPVSRSRQPSADGAD